MITLRISEQEAQLILLGLGELPAKTSIEFILKFKNECNQQIQAKENKEKKEVDNDLNT